MLQSHRSWTVKQVPLKKSSRNWSWPSIRRKFKLRGSIQTSARNSTNSALTQRASVKLLDAILRIQEHGRTILAQGTNTGWTSWTELFLDLLLVILNNGHILYVWTVWKCYCIQDTDQFQLQCFVSGLSNLIYQIPFIKFLSNSIKFDKSNFIKFQNLIQNLIM